MSFMKKIGLLCASIFLASNAAQAVDSVPLQFKEGDVISAGVMNSLLGRLNDSQLGYSSPIELVGTWSCTLYTTPNPGPNQTCVSGFSVVGEGGIILSGSQDITFACSGGSCSWTASRFYPGSCDTYYASWLTMPFDLTGNMIVSKRDTGGGSFVYDVSRYQKRSPTEFVWDISSTGPSTNTSVCKKISTPPPPIDLLTATVTNKNVALNWVDQSTNETGFKVQRKTETTAWATIATIAANSTSYADNNLDDDTYFYRVFSYNTYGDSISSSEVKAVVAEAPLAPTIVSAVGGDQQITLQFTSGGGGAATSYAASCTSSNGGTAGTKTGASSPIVVSSLTNGSNYTCTMTATNTAGTSAASSPSNVVTPSN
jgi:hypothetical protein